MIDNPISEALALETAPQRGVVNLNVCERRNVLVAGQAKVARIIFPNNCPTIFFLNLGAGIVLELEPF